MSSAAGRWVAFLRAINVGGRRVTGAELEDVFTAMGMIDATSYQASGNVVFDAAHIPEEPALEAALAAALGYEVPVFLRSAAEVSELAEQRPFSDDELAAGGKAQVVYLKNELDAPARAAVAALAPESELLRPAGRAIHWLPAHGIAESSLDMKALERVAGLLTVRTRATVERIAAKFLH